MEVFQAQWQWKYIKIIGLYVHIWGKNEGRKDRPFVSTSAVWAKIAQLISSCPALLLGFTPWTPLGLSPFCLDWITPLAFLGLSWQRADHGTCQLPQSCESIPHNKSLHLNSSSLCVYWGSPEKIYVDLCRSPIGYVSLKNPDLYTHNEEEFIITQVWKMF